jgi:hypothetical protein
LAQLGESIVTENRARRTFTGGLVAWVVLVIAGCGGSSPQPKTDLNEQEKQQVRELNEQRADEWGRKK